jgi:methylthioribose-1-phosphate isomerase
MKPPQVPGAAKPFVWQDNRVYFVDQRELPLAEKWITCSDEKQVAAVIRDMVVRGAPAIGIAAALGMALAFHPEHPLWSQSGVNEELLHEHWQGSYKLLAESRPTAVNLFWALRRMEALWQGIDKKLESLELFAALLQEAFAIWQETIAADQAMARYGAPLLPPGGILTHCNTGALATGGLGTALGVIFQVGRQGDGVRVWVDETRPYLQGARLTAYELAQEGMDFRLISDNMAASAMSRGWVGSVIVGADRIAANGDTANKVGTLNLAILAQHYGIPFYVAAPLSTLDRRTPTGQEIPIEEREAQELTRVRGTAITADYPVWNPAFDITPHSLIRAIITEKGVIEKPTVQEIDRFLA